MDLNAILSRLQAVLVSQASSAKSGQLLIDIQSGANSAADRIAAFLGNPPLTRLILNGNNESSFLQLPADDNTVINFGVTTLNFVASTFATVNVAHGFGVAPVVAFAQGDDIFGRLANTGCGGFGAVNFTIDGEMIDGVARTVGVTVFWLAIANL